jgi:PAS domain S-box-containing protein
MKNPSQQLIQDRIKELHENTNFVNTLLKSVVGYAIIAADFDGNILAFNEGARQIYGYDPGEVIGKQDIKILFPEDFIETGRLQEIIEDVIEKERCSYEGEKVRKNGERFPAQILFTLTKDKEGKVVGFIEIVADITERKLAEEQLKRELCSLERLTSSAQTNVTAQAFGLASLREGLPATFNQLVKRYGELIELALEQRAYKVNHNIPEELCLLAERLGFLKTGPRDVVEIHSKALKIKTKGASPQKAQAYAEEGRLLVLELMGYLASYYRNYVSAVGTADMLGSKTEGGRA